MSSHEEYNLQKTFFHIEEARTRLQTIRLDQMSLPDAHREKVDVYKSNLEKTRRGVQKIYEEVVREKGKVRVPETSSALPGGHL